MRVTVYGHTGVVGGVLYRYLSGQEDLDVRGLSLDAADDGADDCEWAFVCVPTPTIDGEQDQGPLWDVLHRLVDRRCNVVIRSTVLPGTCDAIAETHPEWNVYHWPEFLSARTADADFRKAHISILGGGDIALWRAVWEPRLSYDAFYRAEYTTRANAELIKYAHNVHGALQVTFANLIYDAAKRGAADFEAVRRLLPEFGYVSEESTNRYWNVWLDGHRGYGGACFPKDVAAMEGWLHGKAELLEGMERANARLRGETR